MPALPTYDSRSNLRAPQRVDAGAPFRQIADTAVSLGQQNVKRELQQAEFDTRMVLVEQKNQLNAAKTEANNQLNLLSEQYQLDPEAFEMRADGTRNENAFAEASEDIVSANGEKIEYGITRGLYDQGMTTNTIKHGINARSAKNTQVIDKGKQDTLLSYDEWEKDPSRNLAGLDEIGDIAIATRLYDADTVRDFKSNAMIASSLNDAASNPYGTLDALKSNHPIYDNLSGMERKKVKSVALSTISQNKQEADLLNGEGAVKILKEVDFGGVPSDFYSNTKQAVEVGGITQKEANAMELAYEQGMNISGKTDESEFARLSMEIDTVDKRTEKGNIADPIGYSKQVRDTYSNIYTAYGNGKITYPHLQDLLKDAGVSTALSSERVKREHIDPENYSSGFLGFFADKTYLNNQAALDSFMLHTGNDVARSNTLLMQYLADKSDTPDDETAALAQDIVYEDQRVRAEKATNLAIRLLTTKEKGRPADSTATAYQREAAVQKKVIDGKTYIKVEGGWVPE